MSKEYYINRDFILDKTLKAILLSTLDIKEIRQAFIDDGWSRVQYENGNKSVQVTIPLGESNV